LLYTLSHKSELKGLSSLNVTSNLVVSDIWISLLWMERNLQVQVAVWIDITLRWLNGEVLAVDLAIPLVLGLHVSEVRELENLSKSTSLNNTSKSNDFIHELKLDSMRYTLDLNKISRFIEFHVKADI